MQRHTIYLSIVLIIYYSSLELALENTQLVCIKDFWQIWLHFTHLIYQLILSFYYIYSILIKKIVYINITYLP